MEFYRYWTQIDQDGIILRCTTYVSIHESPSYYWCVPKDREAMALSSMERGTGVTAAMRRHKGKRVSKRGRAKAAWPTKAEALESFRTRKRYHLGHATRSMEEARSILRALEKSEVDGWPNVGTRDSKLIPGTYEFVQENYNFDY